MAHDMMDTQYSNWENPCDSSIVIIIIDNIIIIIIIPTPSSWTDAKNLWD